MGECPLWHPLEEALYWVDVQGRRILRRGHAQGVTRQWAVPEKIGCIAWAPEGGLVGAMETGLFHCVISESRMYHSLEVAAELGSGIRFNDGGVDPSGRFVVGSMTDPNDGAPTGCLYRFDSAGMFGPLVRGLKIQNGVAWSPDGATMYLSDSHPDVQMVWAFDYESDSGMLANRRAFVDMSRYPGRPDGTTVDSEGFCWIAANGGGRILRFSPDGKLASQLTLPVARPTNCAFGGANLEILFITTIGRDPATGELSDGSDEGCLFAARAGVPGVRERPFRHLGKRAQTPSG